MVKVSPIDIYAEQYSPPEKASAAPTAPYMKAEPSEAAPQPIKIGNLVVNPLEISDKPAKGRAKKEVEYTPKRVFRPMPEREELSEERAIKKERQVASPGFDLSSYLTLPNILLGVTIIGSLFLLGKPVAVEPTPTPNFQNANRFSRV